MSFLERPLSSPTRPAELTGQPAARREEAPPPAGPSTLPSGRNGRRLTREQTRGRFLRALLRALSAWNS